MSEGGREGGREGEEGGRGGCYLAYLAPKLHGQMRNLAHLYCSLSLSSLSLSLFSLSLSSLFLVSLSLSLSLPEDMRGTYIVENVMPVDS